MTIEILSSLLAPPKNAIEVVATDRWAKIEDSIGSKLPSDYTSFIRCYGTGVIDDFLWVFSPVTSNKNLNLFHRLQLFRETTEYLESGDFEKSLFPVFPAPGGLLPVAATDNGDIVFWHVCGEPDAWSIVVNAARLPDYEEFPGGLVDFLIAVLSREWQGAVFPRSFPSDRIVFVPSS